MKFAYVDNDGYVISFSESTVLEENCVEINEIPERPPNDNGWLKYHLESQTWVDLRSQSEIEQLAADAALSKRNILLLMTDWTQLPDVPSQHKEAWAEYRQKLRDITTQQGYPFNIIWPIKPEFN